MTKTYPLVALVTGCAKENGIGAAIPETTGRSQMLKYYYNTGPNPTKVTLFLEEAGLEYDPIPLETRKGEQFTPEYLAINPNAKAPSIVDGDVTVFDSSAILLYLAEKTGRFLPPDTASDRGQLLSWLMFVASGVGPYCAGGSALRRQTLQVRSAASFRHSGRQTGGQSLCIRRQLYDRRYGGLGLGTSDDCRAGRRGMGRSASSEAFDRRN